MLLIVSDTEDVQRLHPNGPFSLDAALGFLDGFAPAGAGGQVGAYRGAHVLDGEAGMVAVEPAGAGLELRVKGAAGLEREAAALVRRMFSLDLDGTAFYGETGAKDPVLGAVQRRHPGLRPVLFATPWESLCWALIGHRISMTQAARLKDRVRERYGPRIETGGRSWQAFPAPAALLELDGAEVGLPAIKVERLRTLAARAASGELDAARLAAMGPDAALEWLERSPGIGPWSSAFCLIRGVGHPDLLPDGERRLDAAVAEAYRLEGPPTAEALRAVADGWAPFRAWAAFLFRVDAAG